MMLWDTIITSIFSIIDKTIPDPTAKAAAKMRVLEMDHENGLAELKAQVDLAMQQAQINLADAQKADPFSSRWRPSIGWVGATALAYNYILRPILPWVVTVAGGEAPPLPALDTSELMPLILGILGLGGLRSLEKVKGVL